MVSFLETVHVELEVESSLTFLQDLQRADINFFHEAQLLLLVKNKLIIHIHEDARTVQKFSVEYAFAVQQSPESNQLLLSLELQLNNRLFILIFFI